MKFYFAISLFLLTFSSTANNIVFTENRGQVRDTKGQLRPDILFYADVNGKRVYFMKNTLSTVSFREKTYQRMDVELQGAGSNVLAEGEGQLPAYTTFYFPWCGEVRAREFSKIVYRNFFDGTDLVFYDNGDHLLSFDYVAHSEKKSIPQLQRLQQALSSCLPWSTYYGGSGNDEGWGITSDANNNSYTIGYTLSPDFPVSTGSFQDTVSGNYDAFVIKMDSCGNRMWTTFIGSSGNDFGQKICMDGNKIVACGYTSGTDLPVSNAWQPNNNGSYDAFLFQLNAAGARVWATYFGGSGGELGLSVTSDLNKNIFLGGSTSSTDMPVQNAFQVTNGGPLDAFLVKFDSNGTRRWSTYFGGSSSEDVHSLASDISGNLIAVGGTFSTDLPVSTGAFQQGNNGAQDGYVLKLDSTGARLFSTYFGGSGNEDAYGVCTDPQKNIFISGYTTSTDMPVTTGAYQSSINTGDDFYIASFTPAGAQNWCTYFGGSGMDDVYAMSSDNNGHFFILGTTNSSNIPVIGTPVQASPAGNLDAFILKISSIGMPLWSTYYGGSNMDGAYDIHCTPAMRLFMTGFTNSFDFPITFGAYQLNNNSPEDAFITCLDGTADISVGTTGLQETCEMNIFPNPAGDHFSLHFILPAADELTISISDMNGKQVSSMHSGTLAEGEHTLLYSGLMPGAGVYFIHISGRDVNAVKKLLICP